MSSSRHDLSAVQHLSDTIAVVYLGRVMEIGEALAVLTPPFHPYTEALLSAVPVADPDVTQTPIRLGGTVPSAMEVPPGCRFHPRCPRCSGRHLRGSRSRRSARARQITASTATSPSRNSADCRRRPSSSRGSEASEAPAAAEPTPNRPRGRPDADLHRPTTGLRGPHDAPLLHADLPGHHGAPRRRRHHDAGPLRHAGGQGRPAGAARSERAPGGAVRHLVGGLRTRGLGLLGEHQDRDTPAGHGAPAQLGHAGGGGLRHLRARRHLPGADRGATNGTAGWIRPSPSALWPSSACRSS